MVHRELKKVTHDMKQIESWVCFSNKSCDLSYLKERSDWQFHGGYEGTDWLQTGTALDITWDKPQLGVLKSVVCGGGGGGGEWGWWCGWCGCLCNFFCIVQSVDLGRDAVPVGDLVITLCISKKAAQKQGVLSPAWPNNAQQDPAQGPDANESI